MELTDSARVVLASPLVIVRERHNRILSALGADGSASVRDLATSLAVSESTIRRDLSTLDRNGELTRTYGGALVAPRRTAVAGDARDQFERPYADLAADPGGLKDRIGRAAAALVPDEAVVLLDIGTTTPKVAQYLRGRPVTVMTGNLAVLDVLRDDDTVRLVLLGGVLRRNFQTLVGTLATTTLGQVHADLLFLSCTGVRPNGRVVDDMEVEAPIKKAMIDAADRVVLLASEIKFPGTGSLRLCDLTQVDHLVTTSAADRATTDRCAAAGGEVIWT